MTEEARIRCADCKKRIPPRGGRYFICDFKPSECYCVADNRKELGRERKWKDLARWVDKIKKMQKEEDQQMISKAGEHEDPLLGILRTIADCKMETRGEMVNHQHAWQ